MSAGRVVLRPSRLFAFVGQMVSPCGWWVRACDGDCIMGPLLGEHYRADAK